jgi:hypothetical protein
MNLRLKYREPSIHFLLCRDAELKEGTQLKMGDLIKLHNEKLHNIVT